MRRTNRNDTVHLWVSRVSSLPSRLPFAAQPRRLANQHPPPSGLDRSNVGRDVGAHAVGEGVVGEWVSIQIPSTGRPSALPRRSRCRRSERRVDSAGGTASSVGIRRFRQKRLT